ncbi:hypothetical protein [Sphingomonas pruni]|uniref:hypothetical protein n=1 Tax=Sphingomonas pruni TaxID=40683 RepID=UPI000832B98A|nr:hypothetical protein [Sphingomonas pruni]
MTRFGEKLDTLIETVALLDAFDPTNLAAALVASRGRPAFAVASGGSVIAAHYLARCRETLFGEQTAVVTPMELVLANGDLDGASVWVMSAGADNPDAVATVLAAKARGATGIQVMTRNPSGAALADLGGADTVHVVPVVDPKDGFLATHSLVSTVGALLLAADQASPDQIGRALASAWRDAVANTASADSRDRHMASFARISPDDTLVMAADPRAATVASLIETSLWEASLCAVQRTDLRNLAHGRHAWLHHRPGRTRLLAVIGVGSRPVWSAARSIIPDEIQSTELDLGDCGRFRNAVGVIDALGVVEAIGAAVGVDPGKPGIGEFGRELYADPSLLDLARCLVPCVRQKRDASAVRDDPAQAETDPTRVHLDLLAGLAAVPIGGIVLDYDGTVVDTERRYELPTSEVVNELVRLHAEGVAIGVATGRGGSAGEDLRKVLPAAMHPEVLMGYYNGAHVVPLEVNIAEAPPPDHAAIASVTGWLETEGGLPSGHSWKPSPLQITIAVEGLEDPDALAARIASLPEAIGGVLRVTRSGHSIDVVLASASKISVVSRIEALAGVGRQVITVGDSGARGGNDCELLSRPGGISVGAVCGRDGGSHSLFGRSIQGPEALVKVLRSIKRDAVGELRIDFTFLDKHKT